MKRFANYGMTAVGVLTLSAAISITGLGPAAASTLQKRVQQVIITNKSLTVNASMGAPTEPVQFGGKVSPSGSGTDKTESVYTVPVGKRLVIEFVSAAFVLQPKTNIYAFSAGSGPLFILPMTHQPDCLASCDIWVASELTRVYVNAGEQVLVHIIGQGAAGTFNFSGYLAKA